MKQDKIRISIDEILRIVICIFHITFLIEIILIGFFLWICYKQKLNLRRTDAQGQPARASLNGLFVLFVLFKIEFHQEQKSFKVVFIRSWRFTMAREWYKHSYRNLMSDELVIKTFNYELGKDFIDLIYLCCN